MKRIGVVIMMLLIAALACEFSFSTAKIKSAKLTQDANGQTETTVYAPQDTFYCVVQLENAPDDTKTKAVWTAVQAEGYTPNFKLDEVEFEGGGTITFNLTSDGSWGAGQYQVDIYLNGDKEKTLTFSVQ
jgi:hypothetical protein